MHFLLTFEPFPGRKFIELVKIEIIFSTTSVKDVNEERPSIIDIICDKI